MSPEFIQILRCPETRQRLAVAPAELLARLRSEQKTGRLFTRSGKPFSQEMQSGLVREDGAMLYPVVEDIPVLTIDDAIPLTKIA